MPGTKGSSTPSAPPASDSGVCAISPSDLVGNTGNLINEVRALQQRVAELEAANVEANQLSDISQQIGWTDFGTYMGVSGWQQTEYGSLVVPPGVSFSSLGIFPPVIPGGAGGQLAINDADGSLVFGADLLGQLFGSAVDTWNTANAPDYGIARYANVFGTSYGWYTDSRGVTIGTTDETLPGEIDMTISEDGLYLVSTYASVSYFPAPGTLLRTYLFVGNDGRGNTDEIAMLAGDENAIGTSIEPSLACSGIMEGLAGSTFTAYLSKSPVGGAFSANTFGLSIHKISSL